MVSSEVLHDFSLAQIAAMKNDIEVSQSFEDLDAVAARMCLELRWPRGFQFLCDLMKHCREKKDDASFQEIAQHLMDMIEQWLIPQSAEKLCGVLPKTFAKNSNAAK